MNQPKLPVDYVVDAPLLFGWSGTLWSQLYSDPDFLRRYYSGQSLASAQTRVALAEAEACLNRKTVPTHRRIRWYPVPLRRRDRGKGGTAVLRFGDTAVFGAQTGTEDVFEFGPNGTFRDFSIYPVPEMYGRVAYAVDVIRNPSSVLVAGKDFIVDRGTLAIRKSLDPLDWTGEDEGVLWVCDAEVPASYVGDHVSYVFNIPPAFNSDEQALILNTSNAVWDAVTQGLTPTTLAKALGAIYRVETVGSDGEVVEDVYTASDHKLVATDKAVYRLPPGSVIRPGVAPGVLLRAGDFLTTAVQIYYGEGLYAPADVPTLFLPPAMFLDDIKFGFNVSRAPVPIYYAGPDKNGNPKLWFPLEGTPEDVDTFWSGVWARCEETGTSLMSCFQSDIDATISDTKGTVVGNIDALAFMLSNFVGANTVVVAVDTRQLWDSVRSQTVSYLVAQLQDLVPEYARLFIVEHTSVPKETYDLETASTSAASALGVCLLASSHATLGGPSGLGLTYADGAVRMKWVPVCKR